MRALVVALVVVLALLATPVARGVVAVSGTSAAVPASSTFVSDAVPLPHGATTYPLPAGTEVSITLTLSNPSSGRLSNFLQSVEDPASPQYRHFVSFSQYVADFAPSSASTARVSSVLEGAGARDLTVAPDRSSVSALLSVGAVETLFGVRLVEYGDAAGLPEYTSTGIPTLPTSLSGMVVGIGGLSDRSTIALAEESTPHAHGASTLGSGSGLFVYDPQSGENWYVGSDYTQAYGATALLPGTHSVAGATFPSSTAVATLLVSAFNQTLQQDLPPWDPAVVDAYFNGTLGPGWPLPSLTGVPVTIGGSTPPLPGSFGGVNDSTLFEVENSLDLEMAGSLAPGAHLYNFYFSASLIGPTASVGSAADYLAQDLQQALAHNYAPAHLATVSCSFGLPDLNDTAWNAELLTAAATGVTILSASGDQGNAPNSDTGRTDGQWPVWPATAAFNTSGAVSVGGVTVGLSGTPTSSYNQTSLNLSYDANAGTVASASTWWDTSAGQGQWAGSEGGISTVYSEPWWQFHSAAQPPVVNATVLQGQPTLGRAAPDLAMPANLTIATIFANATGVIYFNVLGGTSVAAPVLAGLFADVVAVESNRSGSWSPLGFIDPEIYRIASYFAANPSAPSDPFMGVTTGHNYVFSAAPGWNPTTGWGQVNAPAFLTADANRTLLDYNYTGPTPGLPSGSSTSGGSPPIPWTDIYLIFIVGIVVAIAIVLVTARAGRRRPPVTAIPWGAQMGAPSYPPSAPPGPPAFPGATMYCPACGKMRLVGPQPCPHCGRF